MTTMELIERGIGHNCLSDAYELGRKDAFEEIAYSDNVKKEEFEILAYNKGRADAIDEIETKLVDIILGNEEFTDWQKQEISLCLECVIEQLKENSNE